MSNLPILPPSDPGYPTIDAMEVPAMPAARFSLPKFLSFLRKFWWVPVITLSVSLAGAAAYYFLAPPVFISTAALWEAEKLRLPDGASFTEDPLNYLGTQSGLLRNEMMRQRALQRLEGLITNSVPRNPNGEAMEVELRIMPIPKSAIFHVEASSANGPFTRVYLDALIAEYLEYKSNSRQQTSGGAFNRVSTELTRISLALKSAQDALTDFQRTKNLGGLAQDGTSASAYLTKRREELSDYQLAYKLLDANALDQESLEQALTNASPVTLGSSTNTGSGNFSVRGTDGMSAYKEIEMLKLQRDKLGENLLPLHPKMVKLDEDIARGQRLIDIYRQQNQTQNSAARQDLKIKIASVEASIKDWEDKLAKANEGIAAAEKLKQEVARSQSLFDRFDSLLQNVDIGRSLDQDTLTVLEPASPPKRSYTEVKSMFTLAIFAGLALGFGIIFLITVRDDQFTSMIEVTEKLGDNVVGQVPDVPLLRGGPPLALLEKNDDRHIYAESYRSLRSALLFLAVEGERPKVLLITSAVPNEGKSTIATNLARTMALGGSRVLLVDADLRKGRLHDLLGLQGKPGLAEMLRQPDDPYQFIQTNSLANFSFLARGTAPANPGDLFLNSAFDEILVQLRRDFDYILIDSSPVFAADDATTLAPKVDGTLFVVRSRFSKARAVREALDLLARRQARVLGLVLNRTDSSAKSYHYYNYAEYYPAAKNVS